VLGFCLKRGCRSPHVIRRTDEPPRESARAVEWVKRCANPIPTPTPRLRSAPSTRRRTLPPPTRRARSASRRTSSVRAHVLLDAEPPDLHAAWSRAASVRGVGLGRPRAGGVRRAVWESLLLPCRVVFSNRPQGTHPTGADWGFVTGSKDAGKGLAEQVRLDGEMTSLPGVALLLEAVSNPV